MEAGKNFLFKVSHLILFSHQLLRVAVRKQAEVLVGKRVRISFFSIVSFNVYSHSQFL